MGVFLMGFFWWVFLVVVLVLVVFFHSFPPQGRKIYAFMEMKRNMDLIMRKSRVRISHKSKLIL